MICIEEESINLLDFFQLYFEKKSYVHMIEWAGRDWRDGTGQEGAGHGTGRDPQIRTKRDGTGQESAGHGTGWDDQNVVLRSSDSEESTNS